MTSPLVSVCLITFNHENYIRQAIDSILMQKVNFPWEIIIADDASTDITQQIIKEYHSKNPDLIKPILREINLGGLNFVELINSAKGKYIAYLDGDDFWTDEFKLQKQFDFMEAHPDFSLCYHKTRWEFMYESENWKDYPEFSNEKDQSISTILDILSNGWFIRSCTLFFRNYKLPNGFEKLWIGDYPLHVLLANKGYVGFINEPMGTYRIHGNGFSEIKILVKDLLTRFKNHENEILLLKFLNEETNYKYDKIFKKKIFEEIYSFNHFLFKEDKIKFIRNVVQVFVKYNLFFLIKSLLKKLFQPPIK